MALEINDVVQQDIPAFQRLLKLQPGYSRAQLRINFIKYSRIYHPSIRKGDNSNFIEILIAFEVLDYLKREKPKGNTNSLIYQWNSKEKACIQTKLAEYEAMSLEEYTMKVDKDPTSLKVIRAVIYTLLGLVVAIMVLVFLSMAFGGGVAIGGMIFFGLVFAGLIIRFFKKGGRSILFWH